MCGGPPGGCGCHIRVFQHTMFVHQRRIYNYYRKLTTISPTCNNNVSMQNFTHVFFSTAGATNLLTTSGSVAGGTRCTLQGEGVKNYAYSVLSTNQDIIINQSA